MHRPPLPTSRSSCLWQDGPTNETQRNVSRRMARSQMAQSGRNSYRSTNGDRGRRRYLMTITINVLKIRKDKIGLSFYDESGISVQITLNERQTDTLARVLRDRLN